MTAWLYVHGPAAAAVAAVIAFALWLVLRDRRAARHRRDEVQSPELNITEIPSADLFALAVALHTAAADCYEELRIHRYRDQGIRELQDELRRQR